MGFLKKILGSKPQRPILEYPNNTSPNIGAALLEGLRRCRAMRDRRPIIISWQGQGGRVDSYHIEELRLEGSYLNFLEHNLDLEKLCRDEGLNFAELKGRTASELNVSGLSDQELARLIQTVFTKCLAMRPFEDSGDYCLGFEYDTEA